MKNILSNKRPIFQLGHPHIYLIEKIDFTSDGNIFISGCDREIRCWDVKSGRLFRKIKFSEDERLLSLTVLEEEKIVCILKHIDGKINIKSWNIKSGKIITALTLKYYPFYYDYWACFNNDGRFACIYRCEKKEIIRKDEEFILYKDKIEIIDSKTGEKIRTFNKYATHYINFVPNSSIIALISINKIRLFDIDTGKFLKALKVEDEIESISFDNGGKLVSIGINDKVEVRNIETEELISILKGPFKGLRDMCFSPDGKLIAVLDKDYKIKIWDIYTGNLIGVLKKSHEPMTFNPKGDILVSTWCNAIQLWDVKLKELLRTIEPSEDINIVRFNPQGQGFVTLQKQGFVTLWNLTDGNIIKIHDKDTSMVAFSPDGKFIATGKNNKKINLWETKTGKLVKSFSFAKAKEEVCFVTFGLNNKIIVFASDWIIIFWDIKTGKWIKFLDGGANRDISIRFKKKPHFQKIIKSEFCVTSPVKFSPDGNFFVFASKETIQIWDFKKDICSKILKGHYSDIFLVEFIFNGRVLISGSRDGTINCWDIKTGKLLKSLKMSLYPDLRLVSCSLNGKIFMLNKDREIEVWDVDKEKRVYMLNGKFDREICLSCSPDGKFLLIGNIEGSTDLWEVETGKLKATFASFPDAWVCITPEGYFSGGGNFEKYLHFIDGENRIYEVSQLKNEFYRADLMESLIERE